MQLITLKKRKDFLTISKFGQKFFTDQVILLALCSEEISSNITKFGFTVSKKIGNAPTRNKIKRRLKAVVNNLIKTREINASYNIVIIAKSSIVKAKFSKIEQDILLALKKLKPIY